MMSREAGLWVQLGTTSRREEGAACVTKLKEDKLVAIQGTTFWIPFLCLARLAFWHSQQFT